MAKAILNTISGALATSVAVIGTAAPMASAQGFTGSFVPDQWELFNSSPAFPNIDNSLITIGGEPLAPFNGSVDFSDAPDSLTLLGSNQSAILTAPGLAEFGLSCDNPSLPANLLFLCSSSFTAVFVTVPEALDISFSWNYKTTDSLGAAFDPFGFAIGNFPPTDPQADGIFTELIDRNGPIEQSGTTLVELEADQVFGFQIGTADNQGGRSEAVIRDFRAMIMESDEIDPISVPEPTSSVAIALLSGLGLGLRQKSRAGK